MNDSLTNEYLHSRANKNSTLIDFFLQNRTSYPLVKIDPQTLHDLGLQGPFYRVCTGNTLILHKPVPWFSS